METSFEKKEQRIENKFRRKRSLQQSRKSLRKEKTQKEEIIQQIW